MSADLRIVRGEPTPEELAVVTALVTVSVTEVDDAPAPLRGRWNDPAHQLRVPPQPGPGAWRAALR